ncbi:MAG: VWA domain-containing protein [Ilumatobacteraceae bacterium]
MSWQFFHPGRLWLLVIPAGLVVAAVLGVAQRRKRAVSFTNLDLLDSIAPKRPGWWRHAVTGLFVLGFVVGVLAIAQPYHEEDVAQERSIIMLDLDVSLSMMAEDVPPSRLDAAKEQAIAFVEEVDPSIDIGLISFSQSVKVRVPPTQDRSRIVDAIDSFELEEGTAIGDAIVQATDVIVSELGDPKADPAPLGEDVTPAAIVILTDGETIEGLTTGPQGAQVAAAYGVPVYGIVFGTPEGSSRSTTRPPASCTPKRCRSSTRNSNRRPRSPAAPSTPPRTRTTSTTCSPTSRPSSNRCSVPEPERVELTVRYLAVALLLLASAFVLGQALLGGFT